MMTFPMPSHAPFDDAAYHFVAGHSVTIMMTEAEHKRLSAAELYILETAAASEGRECLEITYEFDPVQWPEVVRLLVLTETDKMQAIFECWIQFDDSNDPPSAAKNVEPLAFRTMRKYSPNKEGICVRGGYLRRLSDIPEMPRSSHGIEGSDV